MLLRIKILMAIQTLPDLGQPVAEAVGNEDTTTEVEEEGESNIFQFLLLLLHDSRISGVNAGEVIPRMNQMVGIIILVAILLSRQQLR